MKINQIILNITLDSKGNDTLEATLTSGNFEASASVPAGKSTGKTEAQVLEPKKALAKVFFLNSQITDREFSGLEQFDKFLLTLDGTENKANLGGNVMLSLSMAFIRLLAKKENLELFEMIGKISNNQPKLPLCFFNLIEGGIHAENSLPFQEYLFIPQTNSPAESLEQVMLVIKNLGVVIQKKYHQLNMGDEGGYTVPSNNPMEGLQLLQEFEGKIGLDVAASATAQKPSVELFKKIAEDFQILSIEDPFDQEDWKDFSLLTALIGNKVWVVGDDLLTTNVERIKKAYQTRAVNAVIIKPNQIGTVTETIQAANLAKSYGWKIIVSHRSKETTDTFIADLAVGLSADGLKTGCPLQKERLVKYQRLIEIEQII